jgi:hypothetical protein
MLITTKRRYIKKHVIGGAGLFDTIANFFKRITESTATKSMARKFIEAGKTAAMEVGLKAIDVGKDAAIAKAKTLIEGLAAPVGSGVGAISIQDYVKRLNIGSGLRLA